jgi:hypothetical protein
LTRKRCAVIWKGRWFGPTPAFLAIMALSWGEAAAADKSKVDGATRQVEKGAKQIGRGQVGPGFKEMFTGVGHTIVEGAKFSGENIKEFFAGKK